MGLPEVLFLAGVALTLAGVLVVFIVIARWALSLPSGQGRSVGVVLLGPVPLVLTGRSVRLALALVAILVFTLLGLFLAAALGVLRA